MIKHQILFTVLFIAILVLVFALLSKPSKFKSEIFQSNQRLTIVHCPTMEKYVKKSSIPAEIKVISVDSTIQALDYLLRDPLTTIAVVGRKAKESEIFSNVVFIQTDINAKVLVKGKQTQNNKTKLILWKDIDYNQYDLAIEENNLGEKIYRTPFIYFHPDNQNVIARLWSGLDL